MNKDRKQNTEQQWWIHTLDSADPVNMKLKWGECEKHFSIYCCLFDYLNKP